MPGGHRIRRRSGNRLRADLGGVMGRSKAMKPTSDQESIIEKSGLRSKDWLVLKDLPDRICLVHRSSGNCRKIRKGGTAE